MIDLDKTDLIEKTLIIQNDDGSITCVPEERCEFDENAKAMFDEFRTAYPEGKPQPEVPPQEPIPTTEELLIAANKKLEEQEVRLKNMENDNLAFQDFIISTITT